MSVVIYGYSDDLIEISGGIRGEISSCEYPVMLSFSDGTVLQARYDMTGCWRINALVKGSAQLLKTEAKGADTDEYSDRVTLVGDIQWVVGGTFMARKESSNPSQVISHPM